MTAAQQAGIRDRRPLKYQTVRNGAPRADVGQTVTASGQPMTVLRYSERDDVYLLETCDGFHTRRYFKPEEITL